MNYVAVAGCVSRGRRDTCPTIFHHYPVAVYCHVLAGLLALFSSRNLEPNKQIVCRFKIQKKGVSGISMYSIVAHGFIFPKHNMSYR